MKLTTLLSFAIANVAFAVPSVLEARAQVDGAAPKIDDPQFIKRIMDAHWYWRSIHCAQELHWDPALAKAALDSVSACTEKPQHDRGGSNLSSVSPAPSNYDEWLEFARTVVHGWHEEELKYPYDNPHYHDSWGHFTQLVWRDTTRIGCALGHCPHDRPWPGRLYCFYENAGNNLAFSFKEQVWPMVCGDPTGRHN
ncbi:PR-1-like protein [Aaosphaeria arxii CBS 175.79]|uniref:PR-1-like protein n=1 Tax=Aaosphaeria arxii CBS 175.79 TaxID=1450172 RepID=A0A6A5XNR1_9PLEO|nr:PR-1-like protein [Aaosphaeria arxii CBS 175.79]KAF2014782.1 PR-1-like protein [Aaosphaeria arxii CBS 175.79]